MDATGFRSSARDAIANINSSRLESFHLAWRKQCREQDAPPAALVDPMGFPLELLPWLAIIDVKQGPFTFVTRLWGTELATATGSDPTGIPFEPSPDIDGPFERCLRVYGNKKPYIYDGPVTWTHKIFNSYTSIGVPYLNEDDDVSIIVVAFHFH